MAFKLASVSTLALTAALGMTMAACTSMPGWGGAGTNPAVQAPAQVQWVRDVHSHARPEIARVGHVDLDLTADFDRKVLSGTATLDISGRAGADQIILDVRNLDIESVSDGAGRAMTWRLGASDPILGQALEIDLPPLSAGETRKLVINYATRPDAAALQWLNPSQTAGGEQPYL
ncbi:MAG TPA: aminopeptidase, partial [Brevundimonas sp.]|nr:aminopeptidase [Brevundimonas sp.]